MLSETEFDDYGDRWDFRPKTIEFLDNLRKDLLPLYKKFAMITGNCCCGSCSAYEVGEEMDETGKPYGLYWHRQDEEGLDEEGTGIYIGFLADSDEKTVEAAKLIKERLGSCGYKVIWDGNIGTRIYVKANLGVAYH